MPKELPGPIDAFREALPTTKHAAAFFDLLVARLGDRAVVQTSNGVESRALFVRAGGDGTFILPWPLVTLFISQAPEEGEEEPEEDRVLEWPRDELGKPLPFMPLTHFYPVPATVALCDGAVRLSVNYRKNGKFKDACRPAECDAFAELLPALASGTENRLERLAEYAASIDLGRHGPARVILPRPTPGGAEGVWVTGRAAIRDAVASRRAPKGSFWAVADGYVASALAFGASREDALAKWRLEVEKLRPKPPPAPDPASLAPPAAASWAPREWSHDQPPEGGEGIRFVCRGWDAPPFDPSPALVPAAAVRVAALPAAKPLRGDWTRWIGERGTTEFAVRLESTDGWTLVGETLLSRFDLATIDAMLDALDDANPSLTRGEGLRSGSGLPPPTHATVFYRCVDLATGLPIDPRAEQSCLGAGFDVRGFDGSRLRSYLVRVRNLG